MNGYLNLYFDSLENITVYLNKGHTKKTMLIIALYPGNFLFDYYTF